MPSTDNRMKLPEESKKIFEKLVKNLELENIQDENEKLRVQFEKEMDKNKSG